MKKKTAKYRAIKSEKKPAKSKVNFRLIFLTFVGVLCFLAISAKLVILQVIDHPHYQRKARANIENRVEVPAKRGTIYDRKHRAIAKDIIRYSVAISGNRSINRNGLVKKIAGTLGISPNIIQRKIQKNPQFSYIAKRVPADRVKNLKSIKDPGLILEKRFLRSYPFKQAGAHLVGFCDVDNQPLGGIEYQYDQYLQGKEGWKIYQKDAYGKQLPNLNFAGEEPINGFDVVLTLDMDYQIILEDELKKTVESNKAVEGVAILMDPQTGAIFGIANYPQFDPNFPNHFTSFTRKNRAVNDVVEPGSTFKIVALTAALENLHLNLDEDIFFCENGRFNLHSETVLDHKEYGWLTLRKVFINSSNIGTMKVAEQLDPAVLYRYVRNFGFGTISGVDLPGESAGISHPLNKFSKTTHYYMSIGYGIGVTPLQLVNAYAAIANGGKLLSPHVMKKVVGQNQRVYAQNSRETVRQVISPETADLLKSCLVDVVEEGTGKQANLEGLNVAGKTGTAQLYNTKTGQYDRSKHLASFVGYFPAKDPEFALLVMVRQPQGVYYGGVVAAPAFRNMAQRIMSLASVKKPFAPRIKTVDHTADIPYIPRVENMRIELAREILEARGINVQVIDSGNVVKKQKAFRKDGILKGVQLVLEDSVFQNQYRMPSLQGLSLKEAVSVLSNYNVVPTIKGHGIVVKQFPKPGSKINFHKAVKIICQAS